MELLGVLLATRLKPSGRLETYSRSRHAGGERQNGDEVFHVGDMLVVPM